MKREVTREELERPLIAYADAIEAIRRGFSILPAVEMPVSGARGLRCAEDVVSPLDVPGFENSAMDGFAVRAEDTPGVLRLVDDLPAGTSPSTAIERGTAATIMTGAPLPPGADAVVPWEDCERSEGEVKILVGTKTGKHVRPRGEDVRAGETVIASGAELRAVHLGVLAALGRTHVRVQPRPRVAIASTGDELIEPGGTLKPGTIYDANRVLLRSMCEQAGADVVGDVLIRDDPKLIETWLVEVAPRADLIVTSGGASVGEHDWMRAIFERRGTLGVWRVAIKPGKPIMFARIESTPVLGLPGNPGSAFVCAHVFVQPAIRVMLGRAPQARSVTARLAEAVKGSPSRTAFCRVRLEGDLAHPLPAQSSVVLSNLMPAQGFAIVAPGGLPAGAEVTVELIE